MRIIFESEINHTGYRGKPIESGPYYHGSSTILGIKDLLLPPTETNIQTEPRVQRRVQRRGKVFFTNNLEAAQRYANVAVKKWGGEPVIYLVEPEGPIKQMTGKKDMFGPIFTAARAKVTIMKNEPLKENKKYPIKIRLSENKKIKKNFPQKISEAIEDEKSPISKQIYEIAKTWSFVEKINQDDSGVSLEHKNTWDRILLFDKQHNKRNIDYQEREDEIFTSLYDIVQLKRNGNVDIFAASGRTKEGIHVQMASLGIKTWLGEQVEWSIIIDFEV